ncbi:MAG: hypothetical protein L0323_01205 [Planctomycetes bacterium]|nr:hypothetical protein [Planctomycetota bacterium]
MPRSPAARDRALALLLAAGASALCAALFQRRWYMDGPFFLERVEAGEWRYVHLLTLPFLQVLHALARALGAPDAEAALRLGSILPGGAAVGLLFLAARRMGDSSARSLAFAASVGLSPAALFFATVAENQALHFASACLSLLSAVAYGLSPSPTRALALGFAWILAIASHTTGVLLGPGLVALALGLAARGGLRPTRAHVLAFALPCAASALLLLGLAWKWGGSPLRLETVLGPGGFTMRERLLHELSPDRIGRYLAEEAVFPAFLLAPIGLFGLGRAWRVDRRLGLVVLAFLLPYLLVMPFWGYPDRGAHFLQVLPAVLLPFLAGRPEEDPESPGMRAALLGLLLGIAGIGAATARAVPLWIVPALAAAAAGGWASPRFLPRGRALLLALAAVPLAQGARSLALLRERNRDDPEARWIEGVRGATRDEGLILTAGYGEPILLRRASNLDVVEMGGLLLAPDPEAMRREILAQVDAQLARGRPTWVDSRVEETYGGNPLARAHLDALREHFEWIPVESGAFRGWRLTRRNRGRPALPRRPSPTRGASLSPPSRRVANRGGARGHARRRRSR